MKRDCLGHGLCGNSWDGLGMVDRHGLHSMRGVQYGRVVFFHADKWRVILRLCSPGASRLGTVRSM